MDLQHRDTRKHCMAQKTSGHPFKVEDLVEFLVKQYDVGCHGNFPVHGRVQLNG